MKAYTIFAYGSLLNQTSLKKTVPEARSIFPAKVNGLQRIFNLASTNRFDSDQKCPICVLNVVDSGAETVLNGLCFEMDELSLEKLMEREIGYDFCRVMAQHYRKKDQLTQAYYFRARYNTPYQYLPNSNVQRHYLKLCLQGSQVFGDDFISDFKSSTAFWNLASKKQRSTIWAGRY